MILDYSSYSRPIYVVGAGMAISGVVPMWAAAMIPDTSLMAMFKALAIIGVVMLYFDIGVEMVFG